MSDATRRRENPLVHLMERVDKNGPLPEQRPELGPCWIWGGPPNSGGYGTVGIEGRTVGAHVAIYTLLRKPVPEGMDLDHLCHPGDGSCPRATCRHRLCVNPDHLDPTTRLENLKRGDTFVAIQLAVTRCPKGHEYSPENTRVRTARSGNPMRSCRACDRERRLASASGKKPGWHNAAKTHCPQGHEYSPENTRLSPEGWRVCIACRGPGKPDIAA